MRKSIEILLMNTECIFHTGHSYQFVTDFEKRKYKELLCLFEDQLNETDYVEYLSELPPSKYIVPIEIEEIITWTTKENLPFFSGVINGQKIECKTPEPLIINQIQQYLLERK